MKDLMYSSTKKVRIWQQLVDSSKFFQESQEGIGTERVQHLVQLIRRVFQLLSVPDTLFLRLMDRISLGPVQPHFRVHSWEFME